MRSRWIAAAVVISCTAAGGWLLSLRTTKVVNWFVMTDELFYVRLAVSIAQTRSPLPRIHGEIVENVNQLYPLLLAPLFGNADVPSSLAAVHRLNAFLFVSAAVPVYLLARRAEAGRIVSGAVAAAAVAAPWAVLASFVLTESVAYPAFCWAALALVVATAERSARYDALAFVAIAIAVLARVQFVVLIVIFCVAVVVDAVVRSEGARGRARAAAAARQLVRRRVLLGAYALIAAGAGTVAVAAGYSRLLGTYAVTVETLRVDLALATLWAEHVALLSLGLGVLPFLVGASWLLDRVASRDPAQRALALVGGSVVLALSLQVASFDQRFGAGLVKDRYLFYAVPIVLVAAGAATVAGNRLRWWSVLPPAAICALGLLSHDFPTYEKLNADSVLAMLNTELLRHVGSVEWARLFAAGAVFVAAAAIVEVTVFAGPRPVALAGVVLAVVFLPAQLVYAFHRLHAVPGTNGLPIDLDQGAVFGWVDRLVGRDGRVTFTAYPYGSDYWAAVAYWWDVEFWNESATARIVPGQGLPDPEPWLAEFDPKTGAVRRWRETRYFLSHENDVRFRLAGDYVAFDRNAYLIDTERPWRAAWATEAVHGDGWTYPHVPARIAVFPMPRQGTPLVRFATIRIASPDDRDAQPVTLETNLERWSGAIAPAGNVDRLLRVCVPPDGPGYIVVRTPNVTDINRDPTKAPLTGERDRPVGMQIRSMTVADEREVTDSCKEN